MSRLELFSQAFVLAAITVASLLTIMRELDGWVKPDVRAWWRGRRS